MGSSQSTNRAAKFSGSRTSTPPSTAPMMRRQLSQRNTNRNVKEFSKFWSDGDNRVNRRSESVRRSNKIWTFYHCIA
ncbi:unnamed protein product [Angiostrongylus costaricensis]|uniref:Uncharacterized protein n=1 Tax=Angiostrongylus costaricensis TaxID=334426 RepID=A0A0R3PJB8_ANGCS|nr:unnamed protein product [Angiostrongylus costaricensis]